MGLAERERITSGFSKTQSQDDTIGKIEADVAEINRFISGIDMDNLDIPARKFTTIKRSIERLLENIEEQMPSTIIEHGLSLIDLAFGDIKTSKRIDVVEISSLVATLHDDVATFLRERNKDENDSFSADELNEKAERYRRTAAQVAAKTNSGLHHRSAVA